ncbi:hypothetical protein ACFLZ6_01280 [Nanoarchaeota archaeon]
MNKKGSQPEYRTLVQLILFAVVVLLVAIPLYTKYEKLRIGNPTSGTTKSMDAIRIEVNNLHNTREMPVYVDKNHVIKIFSVNDSNKPCEKEGKSCICVCTAPTCDPDENEINTCKSFDGDYFEQSEIISPKIVNGKVMGWNCVFVKNKEKVRFGGCT